MASSASSGNEEYVGWVDAAGAKIIVRSQTVVCIIRRPDKT